MSWFRGFILFFMPHLLQIDLTQNSINRNWTLSRKTSGPMRRAYCTICKNVVDIRSSSYVRLANHRAAIEGFCPICNSILLSTRVMPTSSKKTEWHQEEKREAKHIFIYPLNSLTILFLQWQVRRITSILWYIDKYHYYSG